MQLFSAKSLSKKLRSEEFFGEEAISRSFARGSFWEIAGRGPLGESTGWRFFLTKHHSIGGETKSYFASSTRIGQANVYGIII